MLNVPWSVAEEVVRGLGDLSDKIIIDPINPHAHVVEGLYLLRTNARDLSMDHFDFHFQRREIAVPQTIR